MVRQSHLGKALLLADDSICVLQGRCTIVYMYVIISEDVCTCICTCI